MTTVASIIYISRRQSYGGMQGAEQLLLYDSSGSLLWLGTRRASAETGAIPVGISPNEWDAGSWVPTFTKGGYYGDTTDNLDYTDSETASVQAIVTNGIGNAAKIKFSYDGVIYYAYLDNYFKGNRVAGTEGYYIPWGPDEVPTSGKFPSYPGNTRPAVDDSGWIVSKPTVYAETVSPGTAIDVHWTASAPENEDSSQTIVGTSLYLDYSTNSNMTGATTVSLSGTSGTKNLTGLAKGRTYYFRVRGEWTTNTSKVLPHTSDISSATTITPLGTPTITAIEALDGEGSATWTAVDGAVSYEYGVTSDALTPPIDGTPISGTTWNFNDPTLKGKFLFVRAIAATNQIVYENSAWGGAASSSSGQVQGAEIPSTESGGDPEVEPTVAILNRRLYKAIPYIDVPVEQIGLGGNVKDVITVEYADNRYLRSDGEGGAIIPTTSLPWAVYGETEDTSTDTVINPSYLESRIGALDLAYAITEIAISTASGAAKFAGVTTDISAYSSGTENYYIPTTKAIQDFVTDPGNLPYANGTGESGAGIVYISAASGESGHGLVATNGLLEVNFATYSTWNSNAGYVVVSPDYVRQVISGLGVQNSTSSYSSSSSGGVNAQAGYFVKLDANGQIDAGLLPAISLTSVISDTTARTYGTGKTYADRDEAIANLLSTHASTIQEGDMIIACPAGLTDAEREYTLAGSFICGMSGETKILVEVNTPNWAVSSVNGKTGTVTLGISDLYASGSTKASIASSISSYASASEDYKLATAKAVYDYASPIGHTHSFATTTTGGFVIVGEGLGIVADGSQTPGNPAGSLYIASVTSAKISDRITAAVGGSGSSNITASATGVVTGKALYEYVTGYSIPISQLPMASWTNESAWDDNGLHIVSKTYLASALNDFQNEMAASTHNQAITTIYATGTTLYAGTKTTIAATDTDLASESYYVPTAKAVLNFVTGYSVAVTQLPTSDEISNTSTTVPLTSAVYGALQGKANSTHTHPTSQISDAIAAFTSGDSGKGKAVKTVASGYQAGYINPDLILVDQESITSDGGSIGLSIEWLHDYLTDNGYLTRTAGNETYLRNSIAGIPVWSNLSNYAVGDVVIGRGEIYKATVASTSSAPKEPWIYNAGAIKCWEKISFYDLFIEANRYSTTILGDGNTTEFTVTHNLGTKDVEVSLIDDSTDQEVFAAVTMYSATQVKIGFGAAPESGKKYRVVVRR